MWVKPCNPGRATNVPDDLLARGHSPRSCLGFPCRSHAERLSMGLNEALCEAYAPAQAAGIVAAKHKIAARETKFCFGPATRFGCDCRQSTSQKPAEVLEIGDWRSGRTSTAPHQTPAKSATSLARRTYVVQHLGVTSSNCRDHRP